jgi:hypothetical protein
MDRIQVLRALGNVLVHELCGASRVHLAARGKMYETGGNIG